LREKIVAYRKSSLPVGGLFLCNISGGKGKSSESVQCAIAGPCVTGLQHSALYRFGRFAAGSTLEYSISYSIEY